MNSKCFLAVLCAGSALLMHAAEQPTINSRKAPVITKDGLKFRDLNKVAYSTPMKTGGSP